MPTTLRAPDLFEALENLEPTELDRVATWVLRAQADRRAPRLAARESDLLAEINQGLPESSLARYRRLAEKREQESLSPTELEEIRSLSDHFEEIEARRAEKLVDLAELRKTTLPKLMRELGIRPARNA